MVVSNGSGVSAPLTLTLLTQDPGAYRVLKGWVAVSNVNPILPGDAITIFAIVLCTTRLAGGDQGLSSTYSLVNRHRVAHRVRTLWGNRPAREIRMHLRVRLSFRISPLRIPGRNITCGRGKGEVHPEGLHGLNEFHQSLKIGRLPYIAVRMRGITTPYILRRVRGGKNDHWNDPEFWVGFERRKRCNTIHARHVEI